MNMPTIAQAFAQTERALKATGKAQSLAKEYQSLALEAVRQRDELVKALLLVQAGLNNGSIKAKPVIEFNDNAESCDMRSVSEIVDAALAKVQS